ncbi:hypothetical protein ACWD6I_14315 [Streptomyces sp. NPDC002454]
MSRHRPAPDPGGAVPGEVPGMWTRQGPYELGWVLRKVIIERCWAPRT